MNEIVELQVNTNNHGVMPQDATMMHQNPQDAGYIPLNAMGYQRNVEPQPNTVMPCDVHLRFGRSVLSKISTSHNLLSIISDNGQLKIQLLDMEKLYNNGIMWLREKANSGRLDILENVVSDMRENLNTVIQLINSLYDNSDFKKFRLMLIMLQLNVLALANVYLAMDVRYLIGLSENSKNNIDIDLYGLDWSEVNRNVSDHISDYPDLEKGWHDRKSQMRDGITACRELCAAAKMILLDNKNLEPQLYYTGLISLQRYSLVDDYAISLPNDPNVNKYLKFLQKHPTLTLGNRITRGFDKFYRWLSSPRYLLD